MKFMFFFLISFLGINFVLADTTFFEGNYNEGFIMIGENNVDNSSVYCGNAICDDEEGCSSCKVDCGICGESSGVLLDEDGLEEKENFGEEDVFSKDDSERFSPEDKIFSMEKIIFGVLLVSILFLIVLLIKKRREKR